MIAGVAAVAVTAPVLLAAGWLLSGVSGPLTRDSADVLPAYVTVSSAVPGRPRALVLKAHAHAATTFALVSGQGRRIGDADVAPPASVSAGVATSVSALLSGSGGLQQITDLAAAGVGYLVVDAPVDRALEGTLDGVPGLLRVSAVDSGAVWRLIPPGTRVQLRRAGAVPVAVPADRASRTTAVDTDLPSSSTGGAAELYLAEAADPGWHATADGVALTGHVADGWAQAFDLPSSARHVTVTFSSSRPAWLVVQALLLGVLVVLALPSRRRRGLVRLGDDDGDESGDEELADDSAPVDDEGADGPGDAAGPTSVPVQVRS